MHYTAAFSSPLGELTLSSDGEHLTGLWFAGQKYYAPGMDETWRPADLPLFSQAKSWLELYFSGRAPDFTPPLLPSGTPFQQEVWTLLRAIPYGELCPYGDLARVLAEKRGLPHMSARAVGAAVGRNPISILIPCHRVVGASGALTGYAGGLDRKLALLRLEGAQLPHSCR